MPRKPASPYLRTTEIGSFINASWKDYWYRSIDKELLDIVAQEIVLHSKVPRTLEFWKTFLSSRSILEEANRVSWESTTFGTAVHAVVEAYLQGKDSPSVISVASRDRKGSIAHPIIEREKFCAGLIIDWCKQTKAKPILLGGKPAIEVELINESLGITGHPDLVCTFGDDPTVWIADWKTSKNCRDEYGLQLASYALAIQEQFGISINDGVIIRTPSDPNTMPQFQTHEFHDLLSYHGEVFKHAVNVVQYFKHKGQHVKRKATKEAA